MAGKYRTYPEYKDSGDSWVGNMPSHWKLSRVKYIGKVIGGYAFKSSDFIDSGINAIKISNVSHLSFDWTDSSYLPLKFMDEQSDYIPPNGSLVFAMTRPIISGGVKVAKLQDERPFLVNQRVGFLKPSKKVNQNFLMFVTQSESFFCAFENNITTTNQPNISSEGIEDIRFICPGISEQQKIANFLDHETVKIDILIEKQQQLIALLKEKRQAVISHAVTKGLNANAPMRDSGVEWLGEVPEHWGGAAIKRYLLEHRQGYYTTDAYVDNGTKLLRITDLRALGEISTSDCPKVPYSDTLKNYLLEEGDVVFARTGGAGSFGVIPELVEEIAYASYLIRFRFLPKHFNTDYLRFMLIADSFQLSVKSNIHGGVTQNIHAEDIKDTFVASPPLEEQKEISVYLDKQSGKYAELISKADLAIQLMQERRTALISAAVTGKIDVRNWVAPEENKNKEVA